MKADLERCHALMPSRFPVVCLVFLAWILWTERILIIKGRAMGTGRLVKQGFIRTQNPSQSKPALLMQTLKATGLETESSKQFPINLYLLAPCLDVFSPVSNTCLCSESFHCKQGCVYNTLKEMDSMFLWRETCLSQVIFHSRKHWTTETQEWWHCLCCTTWKMVMKWRPLVVWAWQ